MKTNLILTMYVLLFILTGCGENKVFSPDNILVSKKGDKLWVANRNGKELRLFNSGMEPTKVNAVFSAPVNDLLETPDGHLWAVCGNSQGNLYELDPENLSVLSEATLGYTPSSLVFNDKTKTLWITQRYNGELWEVAPDSKEVLSKIKVGREPIDVVSFGNDSFLLVANNLPEMSSMAYPIACQLDIVDVSGKQVAKRILLPNGSTDVKSVAVAVDGSYAYVTHLIARYQLPTNQVERGWMSTNALSVINLKTQEFETSVLLDTPQKGAANPWSVVVSPDNNWIFVALAGSHEVAVIDRYGLHDRLLRAKNGEVVTPSTKEWKDVTNDAGFLYGLQRFIPTNGKSPRGLTMAEHCLYTANYYTGELMSIDLFRDRITNVPVGKPLASTEIGKGDMYFHDATIGFQSWQSCASCHPNDARIDGLNWDLMNDGVGNPKNTKTLMLSHQTPPCMITGIRKDAETAVRSGIKYILFAEVTEEVPLAIDAYLKSLKPLPSPYLTTGGKLSESAERGKEFFDNNCASCHAGELYTDKKLYEVEWNIGTDQGKKMDVPALNEVWRTAPYLYDGRSYTIQDMLKVHGPKQSLQEKELNDLAEYVLSL